MSAIYWSGARLKLCELERYTSPDYCFMSSPGTFSFQISRLQSGLSHCPLGAGDLRELKPKASTRGRHSRCFGSSKRLCEYAYPLRQRVKLRSLEYCLRDMLASFFLTSSLAQIGIGPQTWGPYMSQDSILNMGKIPRVTDLGSAVQGSLFAIVFEVISHVMYRSLQQPTN